MVGLATVRLPTTIVPTMEDELKLLGFFTLKIMVALMLGMIIGVERQLGKHPAGIRTNALVCFGSCMFVSLSHLSGGGDPTRIAAQVVSGIGFIGGGAILRDGISVRGMNTAATMWCSAAIGSLAGAGLLWLSVIGTIGIVAAHFLFRPIAHAIDRYAHGTAEVDILYEVKLIFQRSAEERIRKMFREEIDSAKLRLQGLTLAGATSQDELEMHVHLFALHHDESAMNDLVSRLASQTEVHSVSWGKAH